ncbi:2-amino-4-oxopentanoate thiolase subunit OrtB [Paramaledivibacter caminithermalis]|uniref:Cysteine synthase n=1 Tax=Paramaledivibacter caminithermalis (strain DSM 15212 / CIP 107654 / DViRD3) TaxID=1121301 RepID=A0A1M6QQC6_PARC5|nr:2-amino-4-oxopentanoate thiolase subunit OrtB [Paramaledivibacter caminithermalis]SHK22375.1 Cysteine synthase [Paramaledivibacter caminithermalis DSM 15212]
MKDFSYQGVMGRKNDIMKDAVGIDYDIFEKGKIAFDYEEMMNNVAYSMDEMQRIQRETKVGDTPLFELHNINKLIKKYSPQGKGARIFIKDEAANASGSFKARRAAISVYHAKKLGYKGVIAATSGNYGAAVASQAAMRGLKCIIVQEVYDSSKKGQPEIIEKARKCEAFGAEVIQLTVGPELFYTFLKLLEETGFFNASLYTPFGIAGVETLGYEIAKQMQKREGRYPDAVIATHAGGGNLTGTARGLIKAGAKDCRIIGASVDLKGLHMASDKDFNRKSFTTGHTGFGIPFATQPDRADVPRNAARVLRYMDEYLTVTQGEVFYVTEMLAQLEGLERGPAGNVSLAAAISLAKEMDEDKIIVVQETEYTGAGKHPMPQLTFARNNGIHIYRGDPEENVPGKTIVLPTSFDQINAKRLDLEKLKAKYVKNIIGDMKLSDLDEVDIQYIADEIKESVDRVKELLSK